MKFRPFKSARGIVSGLHTAFQGTQRMTKKNRYLPTARTYPGKKKIPESSRTNELHPVRALHPDETRFRHLASTINPAAGRVIRTRNETKISRDTRYWGTQRITPSVTRLSERVGRKGTRVTYALLYERHPRSLRPVGGQVSHACYLPGTRYIFMFSP